EITVLDQTMCLATFPVVPRVLSSTCWSDRATGNLRERFTHRPAGRSVEGRVPEKGLVLSAVGAVLAKDTRARPVIQNTARWQPVLQEPGNLHEKPRDQ